MLLPSYFPLTRGDLVIIVAGGLVPILYVSRQHKRFLLDGAPAFLFATVAVSVAALAWGIAVRSAFDRLHLAIALVLSCPLLEVLLFRLGFRAFERRYGREPEDIGSSVLPGRWPDVWFRISVLVLLGAIPVGLLAFYFSKDLS
jgi:hypothetical protein